MDRPKVAVVTGGAGFIGSHLCEVLLGRGMQVVCVDNFITSNQQNIDHLQGNPLFGFIRHDVITPLPALDVIDYLFHLASPASVVDYQAHPLETALVNSQGTHNMLELAKEKNARFLYASTSEIYGDPKEHPQKETYWGNVNPNGVRACYDESKRFGEMITMVYCRKSAVDTRIVRIFNTYGPRMRSTDGRVVSNFISQAIAGTPLTIYGDGSQTRSFCFVSDLVEGMVQMMLVNKAQGEVVNLGNAQEYTIANLAKKILQMTQSASTVTYLPLPQDDPVVRRPDLTRAKQLLDWEPQVSVEEGLALTIAYYRKQQYI